MACLLALSEALAPLENMLIDARFEWIKRPPTDRLVLVEIDPESLKAEKAWPWSRARYARAIDTLKQAGARNIGIDIDFSSRSDEAGDEALARTLEKWPGEIILSRFRQGSVIDRQSGKLTETVPHARFLSSAIVASANFESEANGIVRRGFYGEPLTDGYRTSMAATLASKTSVNARTFFIDYSIDPYKIRRISFADIIAGQFDRAAIEGRHVLIGASAIELGDEFVVPKYGLLPGVWLHALSFESLIQNRALARSDPLIALGLALLSALTWFWRPNRGLWRAIALRTVLLAATLALPIIVQMHLPISIDTAPMLVAQAACFTISVFGELEGKAREILQQRRSLAQHQALMALVVANSSDGVIVTDANGCLQSCNQRAADLLGFDLSRTPDRMLPSLAPGFPLLADDLPTGGTRSPLRVEHCVSNTGIALEVLCERAVEAGTGEHEDKEASIHIYWLRDITARKRLEAAERAALDAARESSLAKTQLIANMSHELRTPLNAVIGFSDLFTKQIFGPLGSEQYLAYAQHISDGGQRLLAVVNDVLEVANLDSGKIVLDPIATDLAELVPACVTHVQKSPAGEGKRFCIDVPERLPRPIVDERLMRQALLHLLSNAAKFTGPAGLIEVRAREADDGAVTIEVRDDGIGVDRQHLARLTEAFYQVDARLVRKYEGSGLGLYLVKRYMDLHAGSIAFESEQGKGLTVRLSVPISARPPVRAADDPDRKGMAVGRAV